MLKKYTLIFNKLYFILQGREYVTKSNKVVAAKVFNPVSICCVRNCFAKITMSEQQHFFNSFWKSAGDYKSQNILLSGLMTLKPRVVSSDEDDDDDDQQRSVKWEYSFHSLTKHFSVCQKLLCNLLDIRRSRFASIQKKMLNNESLQDNRGKHQNHVIRLSDELKEIIAEHCSSIPHSKSHYFKGKSGLLCFNDPELSIGKLYLLFIKYYTAKTGDSNPPIKESTYAKYFNHNLKYTFSKSLIDASKVSLKNKLSQENNVKQENEFLQVIIKQENGGEEVVNIKKEIDDEEEINIKQEVNIKQEIDVKLEMD